MLVKPHVLSQSHHEVEAFVELALFESSKVFFFSVDWGGGKGENSCEDCDSLSLSLSGIRAG
jgi:hypothetical protein